MSLNNVRYGSIDVVRASQSGFVMRSTTGEGRGIFRHAGEYVLVNECSGDELDSAFVRFRKKSVGRSNESIAHLRQVILQSECGERCSWMFATYHKTIDHTFMFHVLQMVVSLSGRMHLLGGQDTIRGCTAAGASRSSRDLSSGAVIGAKEVIETTSIG
jgi:hypothetical protein